MAINVKVARICRQRNLHAIEFFGEDDLTAEPANKCTAVKGRKCIARSANSGLLGHSCSSGFANVSSSFCVRVAVLKRRPPLCTKRRPPVCKETPSPLRCWKLTCSSM